MRIRIGYELAFVCDQPTPMILMLHAQPWPHQCLLEPDLIKTDPVTAPHIYRDGHGNLCSRIVAPTGLIRISAMGVVSDPGTPEPIHADAGEAPIERLPDATLQFLIGSRYCETDVLMTEAWRLFGHLAPGWSRVQAICDYVHHHIEFGYAFARLPKTAAETYRERRGVCRDFAHLAIAFCRCLNIPARYCTSYLGDIGVPPIDAPMDFAACMEVYLGGTWHVFDPRNNTRRIGRVMIARGRDAADVAISTAFGNPALQSFRVWTDELPDPASQSSQALAA